MKIKKAHSHALFQRGLKSNCCFLSWRAGDFEIAVPFCQPDRVTITVKPFSGFDDNVPFAAFYFFTFGKIKARKQY
jgi:hypothetical protein